MAPKSKLGRSGRSLSASGEATPKLGRNAASGEVRAPRRSSLFERMTKTGIAFLNQPSGRSVGAIALHAASLHESKTKKLSARVPSALLEEARRVSGIKRDGDLIKAGLAALAAPNAFGAWLIAHEGTLPDDLDLDV